jgi:hypothetical protein
MYEALPQLGAAQKNEPQALPTQTVDAERHPSCPIDAFEGRGRILVKFTPHVVLHAGG